MIEVNVKYEVTLVPAEFDDWIELSNYIYHSNSDLFYTFEGDVVEENSIEYKKAEKELISFLEYEAEKEMLDLCEKWVQTKGNDGVEPKVTTKIKKK